LVVIHVIIELTSYFGVTDAKNMCWPLFTLLVVSKKMFLACYNVCFKSSDQNACFINTIVVECIVAETNTNVWW